MWSFHPNWPLRSIMLVFFTPPQKDREIKNDKKSLSGLDIDKDIIHQLLPWSKQIQSGRLIYYLSLTDQSSVK